jgi:hypothetical protein
VTGVTVDLAPPRYVRGGVAVPGRGYAAFLPQFVRQVTESRSLREA